MPDAIGVINCGTAKAITAAPARELYVGCYFLTCREFIEARCETWVILSARHGVLLPEQIVEPYEATLVRMRKQARDEWAERTRAHLDDLFGAKAHYLTTASLLYRTALPVDRTTCVWDDIPYVRMNGQKGYLGKINAATRREETRR